MKKRVTLLVSCVILTLSLALTGCTPAAPTDIPAEEEPEVVKVGWIGSLTGDQAVWGTCELNTVKMLFEDINEKGGLLGKQVEVIGYDTRGDATEAVNAVRRLTAQDKVIAVLGPNASGQAISISSVLEEMKVPDITTVATNRKLL